MLTVFSLLTIFLGSLAAAFVRAPLPVWTLGLAVVLALWTFASPGLGIASYVAWLIYLTLVVPLNIPIVRRNVVSNRLLAVFRRLTPSMSQTERDALEAGSVWWEGELFNGRPDWRKLRNQPAPTLTTEEQAFLDGPTEVLCRMLDDWRITEELHDLPEEVWSFMKHEGFFGMIIPRRYGGLEFSALAHSSVVMKIASRSISAAVTVMVPNSLGPAELLLRYGTTEQKEYYLGRLARGEEVPCFALTGPEAGSDASSIPDTGVVCRGRFQGRETLGIRLNWDKRYITLGPVATVLGLAFRLYDPEHLLGDAEDVGITLALIPTDTPGITIGRRHAPLDAVFQNGPNSGRDVFIPTDWIIGGVDRAGQGWRMLMECLAAGRAISLPALSTGGGKLASRVTGAYARVRKQFKTPIGHFEGVEEPLARIAGYTYMMDAARVLTAGAVDSGAQPSVVSAIVKYHLTEHMRQVINDAMDIQGGSGICLGPRNVIGRVYEAIPISITVEGANILTRSLIIFGQGAVRCHPFILQEMRAAQDSDHERALRQFDRAFFGHVGLVISNLVRTLVLGLTGARLVRIDADRKIKGYYQQLTRMSAAFALAADGAMLVLGGELKRKEKLSGRLADVLSQLYLASAVLKRYEDNGCPADELPLVQWTCDHALVSIQEKLHGLLKNFPSFAASMLLRWIIFPLGRRYTAPSDSQGKRVARLLLEPSALRDRLTAGMYIPRDRNEVIGRLDYGLACAVAAAPAERKLRAAQRSGEISAADEDTLIEEGLAGSVINEEEAAAMRESAKARRDAIKVDDFDFNYWTREKEVWRTDREMAPVEPSTS